jgi:proline racemase
MSAVTTVDAHVAGGAVRLITAGLPHVEGSSLADRQASLTEQARPVLAALAREPRGHNGVVVVVLGVPDLPDADAAMLFYRSSGPASLCGHALIGATALAIARGVLTPRQHGVVRYDTMGGAVTARVSAASSTGPVRVRYMGPPAMVLRGNLPIALGRRSVRADLAWSGTELVAIVDAESAGVPLVSSRELELRRAGADVIRYLEEATHEMDPVSGAPASVSSAVFIGPAPESGVDIRSGCVWSDGSVERSPGGSATTALAAVLSAMGLLGTGRRLVHQGLLGTNLWATIVSMSDAESRPSVEVEVDGEAWPTGDHVFRFDETDPLLDGEWSQ